MFQDIPYNGQQLTEVLAGEKRLSEQCIDSSLYRQIA